MKFADVKNDVAFRKIFGNANRKDVLISFLNAILDFEEGERIKAVSIVNPFQLPSLRGGKVTIIDAKATDQKGRTFIVEMQVGDVKDFAKRVQYYAFKGIRDQIDRGDFYKKLKPVIFIGIVNFGFTKGPNYLTRHRFCDVETGEHVLKDIEFNFIELRKFKLKAKELTTLVEKWVYFIKNAENLEVIPENTEDQGLEHAYHAANIHTWSKEEVAAYDYAFMREEDERGRLEAAEEKAEERGEARGEARGEEKKEVAAVLGFFENGVPIPVIAASLKISEEKVRAILASNKVG